MGDTIPSETIFLKRIGRKQWQFGDNAHKRVELAALDYYKSKGWQGYLTEHDNYFWNIGFVAGWGDWTKKRPKTVITPHLLLKNVGYSRTLENIEAVTAHILLENLRMALRHSKDYFLFYKVERLSSSGLDSYLDSH